MIPKSIRWRVQLWHTALLTLIVVALLAAFYQHQRVITYQTLDRDLRQPITSLLPVFAPTNGQRPRPNAHPPGSRNRTSQETDHLPRGFRPRPAFRQDSQNNPVKRRGGPNLSEIAKRLTEKNFYCIVFDRDRNIVFSTPTTPKDVSPPPPQPRGPPTIKNRSVGNVREAYESTPRGITIVVGSLVTHTEKTLSRLAWKLAGFGGIIILGGFLVGWFVTNRSLRPIKKISNTAHEIADGDLSKRIETRETKSELGQLSAILDETFEKLDKSFKHQIRFTADASHEMRTPIAVILAKSQFALKRERPVEKYKEALQTCVDSAQHMRGLIESLLELSRVDSGQFEIHTQPGDYAELAEDCANMIRPLAENRDITISTKLIESPAKFDHQRMRQVLINLLSNAVKYNQEGGTIDLCVSRTSQQVTLSIADTGPGIPDDQLPHLFDRFYRADKVRTTSKEGSTGLGLAITKAIVEAHDGTIEVESKIGTGSTFRLIIPLESTRLD